MSHETVSFETTRKHYGVWRWRMERQSSIRFVEAWRQIGYCALDDEAKVLSFGNRVCRCRVIGLCCRTIVVWRERLGPGADSRVATRRSCLLVGTSTR